MGFHVILLLQFYVYIEQFYVFLIYEPVQFNRFFKTGLTS